MRSLIEASCSELSDLYRTGAARPSEVLDAVLDEIERLNPAINAFRVVAADCARVEAEASDRRWQKGAPLSALDGVPVSIKDIILTRGISTLRGSRTVDPAQAWDIDAPSVARLREAGCVLLGKTNTPEFGCKGSTDSYLMGVTRNPYDLSKTSGGSSGGAAAAVAARLGPLALGTDGAGSIRIPSAFCGVAGLKASFGRIPAWPASPFGTLAHIGPHARSLRDLAMALNVLSRDDVRDWFALASVDCDYTRNLEQSVVGLRVAFSPALGYATVDPAIAAATARAAMLLEEMGAHVELCDPGFEDPMELICALWFAGSATVVAGLTPEQQKLIDPMLAWQAEQGAKFSAVDITRINGRRADLGRHMRQFHQNHDVLLTPTVAVTAMSCEVTGSTASFEPKNFLGWTPFSYPFNLTQQPALSLPAGLAPDGLPMGVQLVAPMYADALLLKVGYALEGALGPMPAPAVRVATSSKDSITYAQSP
jgi:aspartyl-tRNA(Asn)/glutamyl-tRNA(Gln) amidotransferase subunit A